MHHSLMTTLLVIAMAAMQSLLAAMPQGGVSLCIGGEAGCVCRLGTLSDPEPRATDECSESCCESAPVPAPDRREPRGPQESCDCGCIDVWVPGSPVRVEMDRGVDFTGPVVVGAAAVMSELWLTPSPGDLALPIRAGPVCCGPPPGLRTTRLLI